MSNHIIHHTVQGDYPGHKLVGAERHRRLYHYTSFNSFVKIWLGKNLLFSPALNSNDILESTFETSVSDFQQIPLLDALMDLWASYKQINFTMDYDSYIRGCMSPMMWGLYADKRRGVCIELDYHKLNLPDGILEGEINYRTVLKKQCEIDPKVKTMKGLICFVKRHKKELFFTKQMSWKGENEYRMLSKDLKSLDITNAINAVYLASCNSPECFFVEKLVNGEVPVKCLRYTKGIDNVALPILVDVIKAREYDNITRNGAWPKGLSEKSKAFYEQNKYDLDIRNFKL